MTRAPDRIADPHSISMVVPVHDVADYLPDFFASLDRQPRESLPDEFVFVDDGSTDGSGDLVRDWIERSGVAARFVRTENGGVSRARNTGLDLAEADWVGFLDPDDVLGDDYFVALRAMLASDDSVDLIAANLFRIVEPDLRFRDVHQLRFRFAGGSRVAELDGDLFVMNAASVLFPLAPLREHGIRFAEGLHASEDALFVAAYLQTLGRTPRAGFAAEARYGYRKRSAQTSAVDRYRADPSSYILRFRDGYRPLLEARAPCWLQAMFVYELQWILPTQLNPLSYADVLSDDERTQVLAALASCLRYVDDRVLLEYDATALPLESRLVALALAGRPLWDWVGGYATMPRGWRDEADIIFYETVADAADAEPAEGAVAETAWFPDYFGQRVLRARRVRLSQNMLGFRRNGIPAEVVWPLPGESRAQAQDRHRRRVLGIERLAIPANETEVVVRAVPSDAPARVRRAARRFVRRERNRRVLWSKDAAIGRLLRPGRGWQIRHDPADPGQSGLRLYRHVKDTANRPIWLVDDGTGARLNGADLFGSLSHRVHRARAGVVFSASSDLPPAPRARVRGVRVLLVTGVPGRVALVGVRRFDPDHVIVHSEEAKGRLARAGVPSDDVTVIRQGDIGEVARILERLRPRGRARRHGGER